MSCSRWTATAIRHAPRDFRLLVRAKGNVDGFQTVFRDKGVYVNNDGERHRSLYPLDHLSGFLKRVTDEELSIHTGTDFPSRVDWDEATRGNLAAGPSHGALRASFFGWWDWGAMGSPSP